eukprot:1502729-Pleurochrysis_carterae.AAC.2
MAERGGVPVRRLAVGVRSHLSAAIADRAYTVIQSFKAHVKREDSSGGPETNFQRARAHRIRSAHQLIRLCEVDPCKVSMPIRRCLPYSSVEMCKCCPGKTPGY